MKKIIFIGCGGSGGQTLRYLMDQASADLKARGAGSELPLCWQFIHIDSPTAEEDKGSGKFKTVTEYNVGTRVVGSYCSIGSGQNFETVSSTLVNTLAQEATSSSHAINMVPDVASWMPRSHSEMLDYNGTVLKDGAGEYRMIGRTLFLTSLKKVVDTIRQANSRFGSASEDEKRIEAAIPELGTDETDEYKMKSIVFVVGSMAGGSGASMLIDVARAVKVALGDTTQTVVFGLTPDVFTNIPIGVTPGHNGNSLAMAAEISALLMAPDSAANKIDSQLFSYLGQPSSNSSNLTFQRFFPIGFKQGKDGTVPDPSAKPDAIYRRLGRGLARLVMSYQAFNTFTRYTLANDKGGGSGAVSIDRRFMNWGSTSPSASWAGFGYASLSMGRDRFREYAGQRLARAAADRLTSGHMVATSMESGAQQLKARVDSNIEHFMSRNGIPMVYAGDPHAINNVGGWVQQSLSPFLPALDEERAAMLQLLPQYMPGEDSAQFFYDWSSSVRNVQQPGCYGAIEHALERKARSSVRKFLRKQSNQIVESTKEAVATFGLEYGAALISRMREDWLGALQDTLMNLSEQKQPIEASIELLIQQFSAELGGGKSGKIKVMPGFGQRFMGALTGTINNQLQLVLLYRICALLAEAYSDMAANFLHPLAAELKETLRTLNFQKAEMKDAVGVEMFATDVYTHWPSGDEVPQRFKTAHNEVVITDPDSFPREYHRLTQADTDTEAKSAAASERQIVNAVITGQWADVQGVAAPNDLIVIKQQWLSQNLREAANGEEASTARFSVNAKTKDVMRRALQYIDRKDEPFEKYITQDLLSYTSGSSEESIGETALAARHKSIVQKFLEVMNMAQPMVAVDENIAVSLHKGVENIKRNLTFSAIPFAAQEPGRILIESIKGYTDLSEATKEMFANQRDAGGNVEGITRVDVFGTYQNFAPITFSSIFKPIYDYWSSPDANRSQFTSGRRTRSLAGFIPVSDAERKALIGGWLLGRILGMIEIPVDNAGYLISHKAPEIYDTEQSMWVPFPWPMYSRPDAFNKSFIKDDFMAAVLESIPLAWLNWYRNSGSVVTDVTQNPMRAYQCLREIYDDNDKPSESSLRTAGQKHIQKYLQTGEGPLGKALLGDHLSTAQERYDDLIDYFKEMEDYYRAVFLTPGQGVQEARQLKDTYQQPKVADIAEDVVDVCGKLREVATTALNDINSQSANNNPYSAIGGSRRVI